MKNFLYKLLWFSILPAVVLLLLEASISMGRDKLLAEDHLQNVFKNSGEDYQWVKKVHHLNKVLLLGSSTVKYGLSCPVLNTLSGDSLAFINLGADARDPIETYFILKEIDLQNVKAVYLGIDPWIFSRAYYKNRNSYFYLDMSTIKAAKYWREYDRGIFKIRYSNLVHSWFPSPVSAMPANQVVPPAFGSAALSLSPKNFNAPVHEKFQLEKYGWSALQFEYLQKIVDLCKSKRIRFTAFIPPKRADFIADYDQYCQQIDASFKEELRTAKFSSPIIGSYDQVQGEGDNLFADAYHLNEKGQQRYSVLFYKMIIGNNN